jgi:large subunit ribosomal protein L24
MKVKKGNKVKVIAGKFKGIEGEVLSVFPRKQRVTVDSVNVKKRSLKKQDSSNSENFIYVQHPIHISNVKLIETTEKPKLKSAKKEKIEKSAKKNTTKTRQASPAK